MLFVSAFMGGDHGTAKSARDFLRAMLATVPRVYLASPRSEEFPRTMCDRALSTPIWFGGPAGARLADRIVDWRPGQLLGIFRDRSIVRRLRQAARKQTVIVNGWASYDYWQRMAHGFEGRKVMVVRESPRHFAGTDRDTRVRELVLGLAAFDALIFVSDRGRQEWLEFDELAGKQTYHLPNCCEEEAVASMLALDRDAVRASYGFGVDEFVVLCPGTIEHRKGQDLLVDLLPDLAKVIPHVRVVFVGDPATEWGVQLVRHVTQGPGAFGSTYMRSRPHILDLLYAADVLAFPSRAEAMPRTILEAMALGTPVVAAAVDGVSELLEHARSGILFPPDDKDGLLQGLVAIAENRQGAAELADNGRRRYWAHFSRRHQFDRLAEILDHVR